jgi:LuxR family maltose regulon positive regulatory protein
MSKESPGLKSGAKEKLSLEQSSHLLRTKFYVPTVRSNCVPRQRLNDLLNDSLNKTLTLISAPAGYGKTTLVSTWLKETGQSSAWLSLDEGDNDPIRFLQYLVASLLPIIPGIDHDLAGLLKGIPPAKFDHAIDLLVNELALFPDPLFIVLDDLHVIHSDAVLSMVAYSLDHLPNNTHLMMLTRTDPPLPLSRLRVRGQLLDVRADQLRFTGDESATFLNKVMGLTLSESDLSALETRTEGWIAGLQLAALSMQGSKDVRAFVSDFTGSHRYIVDYLVEEVLKQQSAPMNAFLLQTSILDRLCGPLCDAVVDLDPLNHVDGRSMLKKLDEANLFVIPLDDERHWYRYHHLFADVLQKRLEHQFPHLLPQLHQRASIWYEENGFIAESIEQAILAGNQERAAQLIEQNGCFLLMSGEVATLLNWADTIELHSEARPWLAIQKTWALALIGDLERVEPTLEIPDRLLSSLEPNLEVRTMLGTIAAARAHCANSRGDTHSAAHYAQLALEQLPDCSSISRSIRSVVVSILGDTSWINGNLEKAFQAYTDAIHIGRTSGNDYMVIIASCNLAEILIEQGQLHRAEETYTQTLKMAVRPDGQKSPLAARIFAGLAGICYERNQIYEAEQYLHLCIDLCQQWGDSGLHALVCARLARAECAKGKNDESQKAMREAEYLLGGDKISSQQIDLVKTELAQLWSFQGDLERLVHFCQEFNLSTNGEIPYSKEREYVILLRSLIAQNDFKAALELSDRLLQQVMTTGRKGLEIELLILQALVFQGLKDTDRALAALGKVLELAQLEGYTRSFLDEGEPMTRLLCQAQSRQVGSGYAAKLLAGIDKSSGMVLPSMELLIEPLTMRELEVLKLIKNGCSNQEIAEQLVISIPTVKRHISNIYAKLGVKSRTQAVAIGKELRIFE